MGFLPDDWDIVRAYATDRAVWWEGDPARLQGHYRRQTQRPKVTPNQFAGGVKGAAARFWHGPPPSAEATPKMHVPIAGDIAAASAAILFGNAPTFTAPTVNGEVQEGAQLRIDALLNTDGVASDLLVAAESCAALGGVYGRVVWDTTHTPEPRIEWVDVDNAYPRFVYGTLVEVTFWDILPNIQGDKHTYRHRTTYVPGGIRHELLAGRADDMGSPVPLTDHPTTAPLAALVNEDSTIPTGCARVAAAFVPNRKPVVQWRGHPQLRHMGKSDFGPDIIGLMDALDEAYTSLMRDLAVGKGRIIASESLLKSGRPGSGFSFDVDREVFARVGDMPGKSGTIEPMLEAHQFAIRTTEHLELCADLVHRIITRAGYSPATFGLGQDGGQQTATEVRAKYTATIQTHRVKSRHWDAALTHLAWCVLDIDYALGNVGAVLLEERPEVDIAEAVAESVFERAQTIQALDVARAASTRTRVQLAHPEWDAARVDEEAALIMSEQGLTIPTDPFMVAADEFPNANG